MADHDNSEDAWDDDGIQDDENDYLPGEEEAIRAEMAADEAEYARRKREIERRVAEAVTLCGIETGQPDPNRGSDIWKDAPVAHRRLRSDGWTPERQRGFVEHLAANGCVSHAAQAVGMTKQSAYQLRMRAPNSVFALAWDFAVHFSRKLLLDEATERAITGREVPVYYRGEEVGKRVAHNDGLMMFLISLKRDRVHPRLSEHEMAELWPAMLAEIDAILPTAFDARRIDELREE